MSSAIQPLTKRAVKRTLRPMPQPSQKSKKRREKPRPKTPERPKEKTIEEVRALRTMGPMPESLLQPISPEEQAKQVLEMRKIVRKLLRLGSPHALPRSRRAGSPPREKSE
jgi:hypothetical protein